MVPDERLRLIFMCCHPALAQDAQLALTLRLVCGVATADIARAFLVAEPTMAARLTRAKKKISAARIPFRVPGAAELPDRLRAVLGVIHLLFTTGHTAPSGAALIRTDLMDQAMHLARMLRDLMPDEREVWGLLALLLVTDARRSTRVDGQGRLLRLEEQDRSQWDRAAIAEAHDLIVDGLRGGRPGRYVLQAAIEFALRGGAHVRRDGLAADRDPLRRAAVGVAVTGGGVEPHGRRGRGPRTHAGAGRGRGARTRWAAGGVPVPTGDQGGPAAAAGPHR